MPSNAPNGLSSYGIPLIGSGPVMTTGNIWFVGSTVVGASNGNTGKSPKRPFATIDYAIGKCTANNGDVIIVMPGHAETVSTATSLVFDVAGVQVIGLGSGASRPTITVGGVVGATISVTAASVSWSNLLITTSLDAITAVISITGADFSAFDCETRDASGTQATVFWSTGSAAHRLWLKRWTHRGDAAAGAGSAININAIDGARIEDFYIVGNFSNSAIRGTGVCTNVIIGGGDGPNFAWTKNSADVIVNLASGSTGFIGPNIYAALTDNAANITEAFVGDACYFMQPIAIVNLAGESSFQTNITASADA